MKALVVAVAILAGLTASAGHSGGAQTVGWVKIYDEPTANFTAVEMFDDERGVASAAGGFFHTTDGGATWVEGEADANVNLGGLFGGVSYISFGDEDSAWVAGFNGQLWHTSDGGSSWARQDVNTRSHFNSVTAVSDDEAWAASWGEGFSDVGPGTVPASLLLHTVDGGATWNSETPDGYGAFHQVEFVDRRHGWLIASTCRAGESFQTCDFLRDRVMLRTEDGGRSWTRLPLDGQLVPNRLQWFQSGRGFVQATEYVRDASSTTVLLRSDDRGNTFDELPPPSDITTWRFVTPERGYLTTFECLSDDDCGFDLYSTTDGGDSRQLLSARSPLGPYGGLDATASHVLSPDREYGNSTGLVRVELGTGVAASVATPTKARFIDAEFADGNRGYAVSAEGLLATDDGGATWSLRWARRNLYLLQAPSRDVVWVSGSAERCDGECNEVYRSVDGGRTWSTASRRWKFVQGIEGIDSSLAWVSASEEGLWRTSDGGQTWRQLHDESALWAFIDRQHGYSRYCDSCESEFLYTSDGGNTIERRPRPDRYADPEFFLTPEFGWASGELRNEAGGCLYPCWGVWSTSDGGHAWMEMWRRSQEAVNGMTFVDQLNGWATTSGPAGDYFSPDYFSNVVRTRDGGRTWSVELTDLAARMEAHDGFVWAMNFGRGAYGISGSGRSTIWRQEYAAGISPPGTGAGASAESHRARDNVRLLFAVGSFLVLSGLCSYVVSRFARRRV